MNSQNSEDDRQTFTRRDSLALSVGALSMATSPTLAQIADETNFIEKLGIEEQVLQIFDLALQVSEAAIELPLAPGEAGNIAEFVALDYFARSATFSLMQELGVFQEIEPLIAYVEALPAFLPNEFPVVFDATAVESQIAIIEIIAEEGQNPVPPPEFVTATGAPAVPDPEKGDGDTNLKVVIDILLESLGIVVGEASLIVSLIESDKALLATFDELNSAISTQDWRDVARTVEGLFKLLVTSKVWVAVRDQIGRKAALRLALRAVPVAGWLYAGAAFVIAIKANYHRLSFFQ